MTRPVTLDLDGVPHVVDEGLWRVWLQRTAGSPIAVAVDQKKPLRWKTLDQLPELSELSYEGGDASVVEYVRSRRSLKHLMWTGHSCSVVDLRKARLSQLGIEPTQPRLTIRTPPTLRELRVYAPKKDGLLKLVIEDEREGAELALTLFGTAPSSPVKIEGVPRLATLRFWFAREIDLADVRSFKALRELEIMGDPACSVKSTRALGGFVELTKLVLRNCYDLDPTELPDTTKLAKLARLEVNGTRREIADALRARMKVASVEIRGIRTPAWIAANLDNPFREWADEYGAGAGAAASKVWKTALKELAALDAAPKRATAARAKAWLGAFVKAFNVLDARAGIDTLQMENVSDAYDDLVERAAKTLGKAAPTDAAARAWFDAWRTF